MSRIPVELPIFGDGNQARVVKEPFIPDAELLQNLEDAGFNRNASIRALFYTHNQNADLAANWLMERLDGAEDINRPIGPKELLVVKTVEEYDNIQPDLRRVFQPRYEYRSTRQEHGHQVFWENNEASPSAYRHDSSSGAPLKPYVTLAADVDRKKGKSENESSVQESDSGSEEDVMIIPPQLCPPCKMVVIVNAALKMTQGKIGAQVGHACLAVYRELLQLSAHTREASSGFHYKEAVEYWQNTGEKIVVLKIANSELLRGVFYSALAHDLPCKVIEDAGRTEVQPGSETVLAIFGTCEVLDGITGSLSLL